MFVKKYSYRFLSLLVLCFQVTQVVWSQPFPYPLERSAIHTGNLVRSAFSNYGNLGSRTLVEARMEWPKGSGVLYGFEFIFWVASEVILENRDTLHIISDRYTGARADVPPSRDHNWGWEPKEGYFNNNANTRGIDEDINRNGILDNGEDVNGNGKLDRILFNVVNYLAMSHLPETWPYDWPVGSHTGKSGDRRNKWNGLFGAFPRADQESYYVMDDRSNDEFPYNPFPNDTLPFLQGGRRGVGVEVDVWGMQWSSPLAEDIWINIYEVRNKSPKALKRNIVGMYVDADVANTSANDASSFDTFDDITYQWDVTGANLQGKKSGYFGFAFLQSPGNGTDRVDNDQDGMVDETQFDGIDNDNDWRSYLDVNGNGKYDFEDLNRNGLLDTGEDANNNGLLDIEPVRDDVGADGIGPFDDGWPGSDRGEGDGAPTAGEPNYEGTDNDEIDQIGLTSYYAGTTEPPVDDELYWATKVYPGVFTPASQAPDIGFSYGTGFFNLPPLPNPPPPREKIPFERFAIACLFGNDLSDILRNKRIMQRIYDADFSFSKPPLKPILTAIPGDRKVYLLWDDQAETSRDPVYGQDFEMYKIYRSTDPNFSEIKTVTDAFGNAVLWKSLAQFDKKDGLFGPHPIPLTGIGAVYDMGTDSGLRHSFVDTTVENGRTYYYAVVSVDKGFDLDFYARGLVKDSTLGEAERTAPTESGKIIEVDFLGNVISKDRNVAVVTPRQPAAGYRAANLSERLVQVQGTATGSIDIVLASPDSIRNRKYQITFTERDSIFRQTLGFSLLNKATAEKLYSIDTVDFESEQLEKHAVDGFKLRFLNSREVNISGFEWSGVSSGNNLIPKITVATTNGPSRIDTIRFPVDFEIRVTNYLAARSYGTPTHRDSVYFYIWNLTDNRAIDFEFIEPLGKADSIISVGDEIVLVLERASPTSNIIRKTSWKLKFDTTVGTPFTIPKSGHVLKMTTTKPFAKTDIYEFSMNAAEYSVSGARDGLANVYVVPDPYVAVNPLEPKRPTGFTGRFERRVEFVNLPRQCTIKIFTVSGKLVKTIEHLADRDNGREPWDLTTKDGLEATSGVYFFHVDALGIGEKLGRFALIK